MRSGFVTLVGRSNVGKSTLLNRLVGRKLAITSDKPQTTRHRITGVLHLPDAQIVFLDTPGVHRPKDELGRYMQRVVHQALDGVDAVVLVVDASQPPGAGDRRVAFSLARVDAPVFLVANKIDAVAAGVAARPEDAPRGEIRSAAPEALARYGSLRAFAGAFAVSALQGDGIGELRAGLLAALPEGPAYFPADAVTDRPEEFLMAEMVREQVFAQTRDEVPHATTVDVERVEPRPGGQLYVAATIYVERDSQKGIVIGRDGRMLREVGSAARREIERVLGSPLYLDLHVKVKEAWRRRPGSLQTLGYRLD